MKSIILISSIAISSLAAPTLAFAQEMSAIRSSGEIESSCRMKAKEIAAETYRGCVTEQKNGQIEQIKKDYAAKLQALKSHYEKELKKMDGSRAKVEGAQPEAAPIEKTDSTAVRSPSKKSKASVGAANAASTSQKSSKKSAVVAAPVPAPAAVAKSEVVEMTVNMKHAPSEPMGDESMMDLPEPIPLEEIPASESSI